MKQQTAVYLRVSTDRQSNGLESQERALMGHIRAAGYEHYVIYRDENISGAKASRPQLDRLMSAVRSGEYSTVFVYSFSRFARSTRHLLSALEEFQNLGVSFISLTEKVDTGSPMGRALFTIISAISQLERELIAERVRNGLVNAKAKGKKLGRPKIRNGQLIQELSRKGMSQRQIAKLVGCGKTAVQRELVSKCE